MLEMSFPLRGKHPYRSVEKNALRKLFCESVAVLNAARVSPMCRTQVFHTLVTFVCGVVPPSAFVLRSTVIYLPMNNERKTKHRMDLT